VSTLGTHQLTRPPTTIAEQPPQRTLPKIISLFSGAGGLDLGFKEAGYGISMAFDSAKAAIQTHTKNFYGTRAIKADLTEVRPEGVLKHVEGTLPSGERIGVIGGPPCQGFSRANVTSTVDDPRNKLPALYLDIVRKLQTMYVVEFLVFENVVGMRDKPHAETYKNLVSGISELGFKVNEEELCATDFGVPQNRRRIVIFGLRDGQGYLPVRLRKRRGIRTVRDAIGTIVAPAFFQRGLSVEEIPVHPNHWTMQPRSVRFRETKSRSEGRSFRKLKWDSPSPTIAFGHREIHVHPDGGRRLSIYEAMLLQGFPATFVLEGNLTEQVVQVSNAVPPPLGRSIAQALTRALRGSSHGI
jgi:DNA (cytosine-5)-methyltransferase 1